MIQVLIWSIPYYFVVVKVLLYVNVCEMFMKTGGIYMYDKIIYS